MILPVLIRSLGLRTGVLRREMENKAKRNRITILVFTGALVLCNFTGYTLPRQEKDEGRLKTLSESSTSKTTGQGEFIKIDKAKIPIRVKEGIGTPTDFLNTIKNERYQGITISVNFHNRDIRQLITHFANLLGYPIQIDPQINGKATFITKEAPWNQVLAFLLDQFKLEIIFDGKKLLIRKKNGHPGESIFYVILFLFLLLPVFFLLGRRYLKKRKSEKSRPLISLSEEKVDEVAKRITYMMEVEKVFSREELSLPKLGKKLNLQSYLVSKIINDKLGRSFPGLLNFYRIKEAKRILSSEPEANILDTAFRVGFKTKTAFNRTFKQLVGETPSQFRKKQANP